MFRRASIFVLRLLACFLVGVLLAPWQAMGAPAAPPAQGAEIHDCDLLASHWLDSERVVDFTSDITPKAALAACERAYVTYPRNLRYRFQYGVIQLYRGDEKRGRELIRSAYRDGYSGALHFVAYESLALATAFSIDLMGVPLGSRDLTDSQTSAFRRLSEVQKREENRAIFQRLLQSASGNTPTTAYMLAESYRYGIGTKLDPGAAIRWYRDAAMRGERMAQQKLFSLYTSWNVGMPWPFRDILEQDKEEGLVWGFLLMTKQTENPLKKYPRLNELLDEKEKKFYLDEYKYNVNEIIYHREELQTELKTVPKYSVLRAQRRATDIYLQAYGIPPEIKRLKERSERGDVNSRVELFGELISGTTVPQNFAKAYELARRKIPVTEVEQESPDLKAALAAMNEFVSKFEHAFPNAVVK